jgi:hypothetical protein
MAVERIAIVGCDHGKKISLVPVTTKLFPFPSALVQQNMHNNPGKMSSDPI